MNDRQQPVHSEREEDEYEKVFIRFSDRLERIIRRSSVVLLILLLIAQLLLQWPTVRRTIVKVEKLEGIPYNESGPER